MQSRSSEIKNWWDSVKGLREQCPDIKFYSISDFIEQMGNFTDKSTIERKDIVDLVFETMWQTVMVPTFKKEKVERFDHGRILYNTFMRYMIGQMAIFGAFGQVYSERNLYQEAIVRFMKSKRHSHSMTFDEIDNALLFYSDFVSALEKKSLITDDDAATYKEIYPMFEPCYVFYDEEKTFYDTLENVYKRVFKL
jgi:hypothetical protein